MTEPTTEPAYRYARPEPPLPAHLDIERFWSYVIVGGPEDCWPWRTKKRGMFWWKDGEGLKQHQVSPRLAFRLGNPGVDLPPNRVVGHRCDWNACCNPAHLECVTQRKNSQDMADRELHPYVASEHYRATRKLWSADSPALSSGEENLNAKLDASAISEIRKRYAAGGVRQKDLAKIFGVAQSHISRIVRAESWSHQAS